MTIKDLMQEIRIDLPAIDWNDLVYKYNEFIDVVANNDFLRTRDLTLNKAPEESVSSLNILFGDEADIANNTYIARVMEVYVNGIKYSDCFSWEEYKTGMQLYRYYITNAVDKTIYFSPNISDTDVVKIICSIGYGKITFSSEPKAVNLTIPNELVPLCRLYILKTLLTYPKYSSKDVSESLYMNIDNNYRIVYNRLSKSVHIPKKTFPFNFV